MVTLTIFLVQVRKPGQCPVTYRVYALWFVHLLTKYFTKLAAHLAGQPPHLFDTMPYWSCVCLDMLHVHIRTKKISCVYSVVSTYSLKNAFPCVDTWGVRL